MTLALALLLPSGMLEPDQPGPPSPSGDRLLWEDSAFVMLEDGLGYLLLE